MNKNISVVINTMNEQKNIERVIESAKWADEILICDMYSEDNTVEIAKKMGAKVIFHNKEEYVEPARNFAISKAKNEWVLVLDPDEQISDPLKRQLIRTVSEDQQVDYVRLPRKNIIFGKWMKASMWWPDYNVRFFKKDKVKWSNKIHRPPKTIGKGLNLPAEESLAIVHNHYDNVQQFLERMIRYTKIQANELKEEGYVFDWKDLIKKPINEFLGRYFASYGFKDGLHGLALSLLQSFSFLILYIRLWEMTGYKQQELNLTELRKLSNKSAAEIDHWFKYSDLSKNPVKRFFQKVKYKI